MAHCHIHKKREEQGKPKRIYKAQRMNNTTKHHRVNLCGLHNKTFKTAAENQSKRRSAKRQQESLSKHIRIHLSSGKAKYLQAGNFTNALFYIDVRKVIQHNKGEKCRWYNQNRNYFSHYLKRFLIYLDGSVDITYTCNLGIFRKFITNLLADCFIFWRRKKQRIGGIFPRPKGLLGILPHIHIMPCVILGNTGYRKRFTRICNIANTVLLIYRNAIPHTHVELLGNFLWEHYGIVGKLKGLLR